MNRSVRRLLPTLALASVFSFLGCDAFGPAGPGGSGYFVVALRSPAGTEGSAVFEITGNDELGPAFTENGQAIHHIRADAYRLVVILDTPGQIRFKIWTESLRKRPEVSIVQVADGQDRRRGSLDGYEVDVTTEKQERVS